jgi:threonine dehydratase
MLTPQTENKALAKAVDVSSLYLKREDMHPYGSHKGRSIPRMMDHYIDMGKKRFAISSSGNAAITALRHTKKLNAKGRGISLDIFIGRHADADKVSTIEAEIGGGVTMEKSERPLQRLLEMTRLSNVVSLRQSTDDEALVGYYELGEELLEIKGLEAVFVGTSSGTTLQGLGECFAREGRRVRLFAVQTTACHPIADEFEEKSRIDNQESSKAGAIVDKVAHRRKTVSRLIRESGGTALIVTNPEIEYARSLVGIHAGFEVTPNGALPLAGLIRAIEKGFSFTGPVALIICGK